MKNYAKLALALACGTALTPFALHADEIRLEGSKEFYIEGKFDDNSQPITLIRTSETSKEVKLWLKYDFTHRWTTKHTPCLREDVKNVVSPHPSCGKELVRIDTECGTTQSCTQEWDPCKWAVTDCKSGDGGYVNRCTEVPYCNSTPIFQDKTCEHPEKYCAEYGPDEFTDHVTENSYKRYVNLRLKRLPKIREGETQTLTLTLTGVLNMVPSTAPNKPFFYYERWDTKKHKPTGEEFNRFEMCWDEYNNHYCY